MVLLYWEKCVSPVKKLVKNCDFSSSLWYNATGVSNEEEEKMKQKKENNGKTEEDSRTVLRGELALLIVVLINSLGVVLMLQSGSGSQRFPACPMRFLWYCRNCLWELDLYFPGASGRKPDDPAEKVCSPVSLQLRGGLCLQRKCWMYINYGSAAFRWDLAGSFCISW